MYAVNKDSFPTPASPSIMATYVHRKAGKVESGAVSGNAVSGNVLNLELASGADSKTITYLVDKKWDAKNLLYGKNRIAALTFRAVPIDASTPQRKTVEFVNLLPLRPDEPRAGSHRTKPGVPRRIP